LQFLSTYKNVLRIDYIDNDFNNISIIKLPPYSPELNPIEQVWSRLRQHHLANRYFNGYESIVDAVCDAWNDFVSDGKGVIEMCTRDWMILTN
jgi:transposase